MAGRERDGNRDSLEGEAMGEMIQKIPDEDAVRRRMAELANERNLLKQLLSLARRKREAEARIREQQQLAQAS
jgi:hypothetical protein